MELQQLRYFLTVIQEKNITRAAKVLRISQPALSRQLQHLEEGLNSQLFERSSSGIVLTEKGYYLAERAKEMVSLADKVITNLNTEEVISGEILIGGGETESMMTVADALKRLRNSHPDIKIRLYSGNGDDVIGKLDKGILDFGLVIEPVNTQNYESFPLPLRDRWGVLMRRDSDLAKKKHIYAEDLMNIPLIVSEQTLVNSHLSSHLNLDLNTCNIIVTYNLLYNASLLVRAGIGYALCLDKIIHTEGTDLTFIPLAPHVESEVYLIWKKQVLLSNAAKKFLNTLLN